MKRKIFRLPNELLKRLIDLKGVRIFAEEQDIPKKDDSDSTLVIVKGRATVLKNDSEFIEINPGYALTMDDLHLRAKKNLQVIFLGSRDFLEGAPVQSLFRGYLGPDRINA